LTSDSALAAGLGPAATRVTLHHPIAASSG